MSTFRRKWRCFVYCVTKFLNFESDSLLHKRAEFSREFVGKTTRVWEMSVKSSRQWFRDCRLAHISLTATLWILQWKTIYGFHRRKFVCNSVVIKSGEKSNLHSDLIHLSNVLFSISMINCSPQNISFHRNLIALDIIYLTALWCKCKARLYE